MCFELVLFRRAAGLLSSLAAGAREFQRWRAVSRGDELENVFSVRSFELKDDGEKR